MQESDKITRRQFILMTGLGLGLRLKHHNVYQILRETLTYSETLEDRWYADHLMVMQNQKDALVNYIFNHNQYQSKHVSGVDLNTSPVNFLKQMDESFASELRTRTTKEEQDRIFQHFHDQLPQINFCGIATIANALIALNTDRPLFANHDRFDRNTLMQKILVDYIFNQQLFPSPIISDNGVMDMINIYRIFKVISQDIVINGGNPFWVKALIHSIDNDTYLFHPGEVKRADFNSIYEAAEFVENAGGVIVDDAGINPVSGLKDELPPMPSYDHFGLNLGVSSALLLRVDSLGLAKKPNDPEIGLLGLVDQQYFCPPNEGIETLNPKIYSGYHSALAFLPDVKIVLDAVSKYKIKLL